MELLQDMENHWFKMSHCFKCPGEVLYSCLTHIKLHRILLEMTEYMLISITFFSSVHSLSRV